MVIFNNLLIFIGIGSFCLALRPFDQMWCRAIILQVDMDDFIARLKCVDDGSTFEVQTPIHLKSSSIHLVFKTYFGLNCSLPFRCYPKKENETAGVLQRMKNQDMSYRLITDHEGLRIVELYAEGQNVTDLLVQMGCGKRLAFVPSGEAYIINVGSTVDFSVQLESESNLLKDVTDYTKRYLHEDVDSPKVGMIVVVRSTDDFWYRAKIMTINKNEFDVYFIDLGCSIRTVTEVGAIKDEIIEQIHPLAYKCALALPRGMKSGISGAGERQFKEWAKHGMMNIKFIRPSDDFAIVDVKSGDKDFVSQVLYTVHGNYSSDEGQSSEYWQ